MLPSRVAKQSLRIKTKPCKDIIDTVIRFRKVLKDIKTGNFALRNQHVFLANMHYNVGLTAIRYHTYLVSGKPNSRLPRDKARVYGFIPNYYRKSILITSALVKKCESLDIDPQIKRAIHHLKDRKFDDVEHLIAKVQEITGLSSKTFYDDMKEVNYFYFILHGVRGSYVPITKQLKPEHVEIVNFECNNAEYRDTQIAPIEMLEIQQEQLTYQLYREEKLNIPTSSSSNGFIRDFLKKNILAKRVEQVEFPSCESQSNCNSATATFLEFVLNRHHKTSTLTRREIVSESKYTYGINHRSNMMHDPLIIDEGITELRNYIKLRNSEEDNFWGWLFNRDKKIKVNTATHIISLLTGTTKENLNNVERSAMNQGRLKEICEKYRIKI